MGKEKKSSTGGYFSKRCLTKASAINIQHLFLHDEKANNPIKNGVNA